MFQIFLILITRRPWLVAAGTLTIHSNFHSHFEAEKTATHLNFGKGIRRQYAIFIYISLYDNEYIIIITKTMVLHTPDNS